MAGALHSGKLTASGFFIYLWLLFPAIGFGNPLTLREATTKAIEAFQAGDYALANAAFSILETEFSREPEYLEMRDTLLPVQAYAALRAGEAENAAAILGERLQREVKSQRVRRFMLYCHADALRQSRQGDRAIAAYQLFLTVDDLSVQSATARLRLARLLFDQNRHEEGLDLLKQFITDKRFAPSLRTQARLLAVQLSQSHQLPEEAVTFLLQDVWSVDAMPELAVLAFSALQAGDYLLAQERFEEALQSYRLVPAKDILVQVQSVKVAGIRSRLEQRKAHRSRVSLGSAISLHEQMSWDNHYTGVIRRAEAQLATLEKADDYTFGLYLRIGQAFLRSGRLPSASVVFAELAGDEAFLPSEQGEALYNLVLVELARERFDLVYEKVQEYADRFPGGIRGPEVLFLSAQAMQEEKRYEDAATLLGRLLTDFPTHAHTGRWMFSRGLNLALAQDYEGARETLESFRTSYPNHLLNYPAWYWIALTRFFEKDYPAALEVLDQLIGAMPPGHPLLAEALYRRCNVLYASGDYENAGRALEAFIDKHQGHKLEAEARALLGDVWMGKGDLSQALDVFAGVQPSDGPQWYGYAIFQAGKIFKALEELEQLEAHFRQYLEVLKDPVLEQHRMAEALYWIGWANIQKDQPSAALPVFFEALDTVGNVPAAHGVLDIIREMQRLHQKINRLNPNLANGEISERVQAFIAADSFENWLRAEASKASLKRYDTLAGRLKLALANSLEKQGREDAADGILFELMESTPESAFDAALLARAGLLLSGSGLSRGREYLETLIEVYPQAPERGDAWFGLANLDVMQDDFPGANRWLTTFREEVPLHPKRHEATLLQARIQIQQGAAEQAIELLNSVLKEKGARGRPHAEAVFLLGNAYRDQAELRKAIASYQRVFTLYRAFGDLVAAAYLEAARAFERLGRREDALRHLDELLGMDDLKYQIAYLDAVELRASWAGSDASLTGGNVMEAQ